MGLPTSLWLDAVRAVPTIGLNTVTTFEPAVALAGKLRHLMQKWDASMGLASVDIEDNNQVLKLQRKDGVQISVSHSHVVVRHFFLTELIEKSGADPETRLTTPVAPYQELLGNLREVLKEVVQEVTKDGARQVSRIGVVAEGKLDPTNLPPGIQSYLEFLSRPWGGSVIELNGAVTATLGEDSISTWRCHHILQKGHGETDAYPLKLDWQKIFKEPAARSLSKLMEEVASCGTSASQYFDQFGLGDLSYGSD